MRRRIIAVIGNRQPPPPALPVAEELGRRLVDNGWRLVTGGLGGVMEAVSRGARQSARYQEGDILGIIPGPDAQAANPYVDIVIPSNLGYARNVLVVSSADAVVAVGGGAGTLSEMAMAWQLGRPVVGLAVPGWSARLAGEALDAGRPDRVIAAGTPVEAVNAIRAVFIG